MKLQSYVCGDWQTSSYEGTALRDASTGEVIARASSGGLDFAAVLTHAREVGGPALRARTFHGLSTFKPTANQWEFYWRGGVKAPNTDSPVPTSGAATRTAR